MFEISGVPEETAKEALRLASHKLPCRCKIVSKADLEGGDVQMKTNKYVEDLKAKSAAELAEELVSAKKELFNLRFQNATNQLRTIPAESKKFARTLLEFRHSD